LASGASQMSALIITLMLGGCRFILQAAAQPMIDMGLYLALAALAYFLATRQWIALCVWLPLMALSKEVIYPLLVLPVFLVPKGRRLLLGGSYLVTAGLVWGVRHWVSAHSAVGIVCTLDPGWSYESNSIFEVIAKSWRGAAMNGAYLLTLRGLFDVLIAFGPLWILFGYALKYKRLPRQIWLWTFLPYALWCGLLSRHWGRMLTIAFPLVIMAAALGLQQLTDKWRSASTSAAREL